MTLHARMKQAGRKTKQRINQKGLGLTAEAIRNVRSQKPFTLGSRMNNREFSLVSTKAVGLFIMYHWLQMEGVAVSSTNLVETELEL